jgi:hypothetical protein
VNATGVFARLALLFIPIASFAQSGVHLEINEAHLDSVLMPESDEQFYPVGVLLLADSPRNLSICREQKRRPMRTRSGARFANSRGWGAWEGSHDEKPTLRAESLQLVSAKGCHFENLAGEGCQPPAYHPGS